MKARAEMCEISEISEVSELSLLLFPGRDPSLSHYDLLHPSHHADKH